MTEERYAYQFPAGKKPKPESRAWIGSRVVVGQNEGLGFSISGEFGDFVEPRVDRLAGWAITIPAQPPPLVEKGQLHRHLWRSFKLIQPTENTHVVVRSL